MMGELERRVKAQAATLGKHEEWLARLEMYLEDYRARMDLIGRSLVDLRSRIDSTPASASPSSSGVGAVGATPEEKPVATPSSDGVPSSR